MSLEAVVFDFDGLILDTEWGIFETACKSFATLGHELTLEAWATVVGLSGDDEEAAWSTLCDAMGVVASRDEFTRAYATQDRPDRDHLLPLPGVVELIDAAGAAAVPLGVASSSEVAWLHRHLGRLSLLDRFGAIVGSDLVGGVGKPAPDVYLHACEQLGVAPGGAVAIEDSAHGVTAAKAAGMRVVAVPSEITRWQDFTHADLVLSSVADVALTDLAALVA
jgi:HAD superfamily hydrolase (TIGR01509 family)